MENFGITISLIENDENIVQRTAESFEIAEQNLDSLEKWYENRKFIAEQNGIMEEKLSEE